MSRPLEQFREKGLYVCGLGIIKKKRWYVWGLGIIKRKRVVCLGPWNN